MRDCRPGPEETGNSHCQRRRCHYRIQRGGRHVLGVGSADLARSALVIAVLPVAPAEPAWQSPRSPRRFGRPRRGRRSRTPGTAHPRSVRPCKRRGHWCPTPRLRSPLMVNPFVFVWAGKASSPQARVWARSIGGHPWGRGKVQDRYSLATPSKTSREPSASARV